MVVGAVVAIVLAARALGRKFGLVAAFRSLRQNLGRAILLGLEFLVAADIIRTVSTVPTLLQVAVLGGIVLIRTLLSFTVEVELEGRWPWQRRRRKDEGARPDGSATSGLRARSSLRARTEPARVAAHRQIAAACSPGCSRGSE